MSGSVYNGIAYRGNKSLRLYRGSAGTASGVQTSFTAKKEATYTFSAWVRTGSGAVYLALYDGSSTVTSETLPANSGWTRLQVSYTNTSGNDKTVYPRLMTAAAGTAYMDCVQVELAPTASRVNLVENGDFRFTTGWSSTAGRTTSSTIAAPQLSSNVYKLTGTYNSTNRIYQTIPLNGSAGETFIVGGWAKGDATPGVAKVSGGESTTISGRTFAIMAVFNYTDGTTSGYITIPFNPDVEAWQYTAAPIVSTKA